MSSLLNLRLQGAPLTCVSLINTAGFPKKVVSQREKNENTDYQKENKDFPSSSSLSHANGKSSGKSVLQAKPVVMIQWLGTGPPVDWDSHMQATS